MKKICLFVTLLFLSACTPSAKVVQTAIAQTQSALPTNTPSDIATRTPFLLIIPTAPPTATKSPVPSTTVGLIRAGSQVDVDASITPTLTQEESDSISWDEAGDYVGKLITVCGPVIAGYFAKSSSGQPTFLNLGKDYPDTTRFVVLIWGSDRARFPSPPEQYYLEKTICVRGIISVFQGLVEMEIKDPDQIIIK